MEWSLLSNPVMRSAFFLLLLAACGTTTTTNQDAGADGQSGCNCSMGRTCCNGQCVNTGNDPQNCNGCGVKCSGATPYCDNGCKAATCMPACTGSQICCRDDGPVGGTMTCFTPTATEPTCPQGCAPLCKSDRNVKYDFEPVSGREVAQTLAQHPNDFHEAFGVGHGAHAEGIDAHGVAFAGIQGLYEMVQEQNERLDALERRRK